MKKSFAIFFIHIQIALFSGEYLPILLLKVFIEKRQLNYVNENEKYNLT